MKRFKIIILTLVTICFFTSCKDKSSNTNENVTSKEINVAAIFSLTGEAKEDNSGAVVGIEKAVQFYNDLDKKYTIKLILIDNESTAEGAYRAAKEAAEKQVDFIIGASWSSHSMKVAKVAQENKIPMITNVSTHPDVTKIGNYIFRVCFTDPYQGKVMARMAHEEFDAKKAIVITHDEEYSKSLSREFIDEFKKMNGHIEQQYFYKMDHSRFNEIVDSVKTKDAQVIFIPGHHESGTFIKLLKENNITLPVLGGDGWGTPGFFNEEDGSSHLAFYCSHWSKELQNDESKEFLKYFGDNQYTIAPAALSFDALLFTMQALETLQDYPIDSENLKDALYNMKGYKGITGSITLDDNGDPVDKDAVIIRVKDRRNNFYKAISNGKSQ